MRSARAWPPATALSRRELLIAGAVGGAFVPAAGWGQSPAPSRQSAINVRDFGAAGDGRVNDNEAFSLALRRSRTLYVPAGVYLVDRLVLPRGTTLFTDGFETIFRQRPGLPEAIRILNVGGSDIWIGDCTVEGSITTDPGEQRHGINVSATARTGDVSNIRIGNVHGRNLRGDVVYIGSNDGRSVSAVRVGDVRGSNIFRNIVSVVGGRNISIGNISGTNVGYTHLDIEPEEYSGPLDGCTVESVTGGFVQIAGQSAKSYAGQVRIRLLDLVGSLQHCIPPYKPGLDRKDALVVRNIRSLEIGRLVARGFDGAAIRQVWDPGALSDQRIHIHQAELSDCARSNGHAYVLGSPRATKLFIDDLVVDRLRAGLDVIHDCKEAHIGKVRGRLPQGSRLIAQSEEIPLPLYWVGGAAAVAAALLLRRR